MVSIAFLGDVSFNDDYIRFFQKGMNPFETIQPIFESKDFVIGNLECIVRGDSGENLLKKPRLSTTVETLNYLRLLKINIVSLAHNHVYDHLEDGFLKTTAFLFENNIRYIGASLNKPDAEKPLIIIKKGIRIGLLNYITPDTNPCMPLDATVFLNHFRFEKTINDIKLLKGETDQIVLLLHWGGRVEGGLFPDFNQPDIARQLIDAGADLIIGHHSHTLQPFEIYKSKYIFYSLGNFCFDDYLFDGKKHALPLRQKISTVVSVDFNKSDYFVDFSFFMNRKTTFIKTDYFRKLQMRNKLFKILTRSLFLWNVYYYHKIYVLPFILFIKRKDLNLIEITSRISRALLRRIFQFPQIRVKS
jgi:hypothetical protein